MGNYFDHRSCHRVLVRVGHRLRNRFDMTFASEQTARDAYEDLQREVVPGSVIYQVTWLYYPRGMQYDFETVRNRALQG